MEITTQVVLPKETFSRKVKNIIYSRLRMLQVRFRWRPPQQRFANLGEGHRLGYSTMQTTCQRLSSVSDLPHAGTQVPVKFKSHVCNNQTTDPQESTVEVKQHFLTAGSILILTISGHSVFVSELYLFLINCATFNGAQNGFLNRPIANLKRMSTNRFVQFFKQFFW